MFSRSSTLFPLVLLFKLSDGISSGIWRNALFFSVFVNYQIVEAKFLDNDIIVDVLWYLKQRVNPGSKGRPVVGLLDGDVELPIMGGN